MNLRAIQVAALLALLFALAACKEQYQRPDEVIASDGKPGWLVENLGQAGQTCPRGYVTVDSMLWSGYERRLIRCNP